jgi:hypothetical protein
LVARLVGTGAREQIARTCAALDLANGIHGRHGRPVNVFGANRFLTPRTWRSIASITEPGMKARIRVRLMRRVGVRSPSVRDRFNILADLNVGVPRLWERID